MNQTLIRLIGKLDEDKKACWSKHLARATDGIQFHVLSGDWIQSSLPAFWQEAEDTGGLLVSDPCEICLTSLNWRSLWLSIRRG